MKRSEFSNRLGLYTTILKINIVNSWRLETAYFANGWGNVLSTIAYTITFLVFISVIFANVHTMAGYTRDQMLLLLLVGQITFYITYAWTWNNLESMVTDVNRGSFDLLLSKPLPALFYTSVRNISLLPQLRDGLPSLFFVAIAINWSNITIHLAGLICGVLIMVLGQFAVNAAAFLFALPVFWTGQAADSLNLAVVLFSVTDPPFDGVPKPLRFTLIYLLPVLVPTALATTVMLGKTSALFGLALAVSATVILVSIKIGAWKIALRNYTSASS